MHELLLIEFGFEVETFCYQKIAEKKRIPYMCFPLDSIASVYRETIIFAHVSYRMAFFGVSC